MNSFVFFAFLFIDYFENMSWLAKHTTVGCIELWKVVLCNVVRCLSMT